jgi:plasmid stabilization system protein ParE
VSRGYSLTPEARGNVDEICAFVAQDSIDAAIRVLEALEHAFELLGTAPDIGHKREDLTTRPVKFWSVYSYLIVYDPATAPLSILAVLHGARDLERLLKDDAP